MTRDPATGDIAVTDNATGDSVRIPATDASGYATGRVEVRGTSGADSIAIQDGVPGMGQGPVVAAFGEAGDDQLTGNILYGGAGDDALTGTAGNDALAGGDGADTITGTAGNDELWGNGGDDTLQGGDGYDVLNGGGGDDRADGEGGQDAVFGGDGNDTLAGGDGSDRIIGGTGSDEMSGGAGHDYFTSELNAQTNTSGATMQLRDETGQPTPASGDVVLDFEDSEDNDYQNPNDPSVPAVLQVDPSMDPDVSAVVHDDISLLRATQTGQEALTALSSSGRPAGTPVPPGAPAPVPPGTPVVVRDYTDFVNSKAPPSGTEIYLNPELVASLPVDPSQPPEVRQGYETFFSPAVLVHEMFHEQDFRDDGVLRPGVTTQEEFGVGSQAGDGERGAVGLPTATTTPSPKPGAPPTVTVSPPADDATTENEMRLELRLPARRIY